MKRKRKKTRNKSAKFERCVRAVKKSRARIGHGKGRPVNPWAVCHASLNRRKRRRDPQNPWVLSRDGKEVKHYKTADAALAALHKLQGQSWDYALRYGGWALHNHDTGERVIPYSTKKSRRDPRGALVNRPVRRSMPSQREYESREIAFFHKHLQEVERAPLADRKAGAKEFAHAMAHDPELVAERVGWLLSGNYGYGSYVKAGEVARSPRMNRVAWLTQTVGSLEWSSPWAMTRAQWKKLTPEQKKKLDSAVKYVIATHLRES